MRLARGADPGGRQTASKVPTTMHDKRLKHERKVGLGAVMRDTLYDG